ncbi:MAG: ACP S-malonyltransferase [Spirochaetaceae bacterium]|jgi:[acyl-carrier-protein] S-malonyltransferase|nr:ACP S-malonyltransferase [Spirochaetaceae bacterium]
MVNNPAFLFPGQGAQYQGMALDLFEAGGTAVRELFTLASDIMGRDMKALLAEADGETLKRSDISQPAITLANLAAARYLEERGIRPVAVAGFSLGEYAALVAASVIDAAECLRLVKIRGAAMQEASDRLGAAGGNPGMAAILGLSPEKVEALIAEWRIAGLPDLYGANFNSRTQVVVSGTAEALAEAERRFKEAGARRVVRLPVAGPFHSPLMAAAADAFAPALEAADFKDPAIPLFSNVSGGQVTGYDLPGGQVIGYDVPGGQVVGYDVSGGRVTAAAAAKALALRQITEPVRWTAEEAALAVLGPDAVLEAGPGKVLQGLWKDADTGVPCFAAGTAAEIDALGA